MKMFKVLVPAMVLGFSTIASANHKDHHDMPNKMLEKMDTNSDGMVSKDEYTKAKMDSFTEADKNSDGNLSKDELEGMSKEMHHKHKEHKH